MRHFGARICAPNEVEFALWAPDAKTVDVVLNTTGDNARDDAGGAAIESIRLTFAGER